jgi:hypothetical protein
MEPVVLQNLEEWDAPETLVDQFGAAVQLRQSRFHLLFHGSC